MSQDVIAFPVPNSVIRVDELEWVPYVDPDTGDAWPEIWTKSLADPTTGTVFMSVKLGPNATGPAHWHLSDTVYIIRRGEMHIEKEGIYKEGDVRWVQGGRAYPPELPGPDGVEFYFVSVGPYGLFEADTHPAPRGRWDDLPAG